jgi:hypothetical protein
MWKKEKTQRRRALPANLALVSSIRNSEPRTSKSTKKLPKPGGDKYYVAVGKIAHPKPFDVGLVAI